MRLDAKIERILALHKKLSALPGDAFEPNTTGGEALTEFEAFISAYLVSHEFTTISRACSKQGGRFTTLFVGAWGWNLGKSRKERILRVLENEAKRLKSDVRRIDGKKAKECQWMPYSDNE